MSGTQEWRPCHICGEKVLWQTNGIGWHRIQYHDCKPVPLARLQHAERERDKARELLAQREAEKQIAGLVGALQEVVECLRGTEDKREIAKEVISRALAAAAHPPAPLRAHHAPGEDTAPVFPAPDPEREAMAKVCEAAQDYIDAQGRYGFEQQAYHALDQALADLERARKGGV